MQLSQKKILTIGVVATVCAVATGIVVSQIKPYRFKKEPLPSAQTQAPQESSITSEYNSFAHKNYEIKKTPTPEEPTQIQNNTPPPQQTSQSTTPTTPTKPTSVLYNEARKTYLKIFDIYIDKNGFNPYQLVVHQNDQLQINIKIEGKATDIVSRGLDVSIDTLQPGQSHVLIMDAYKQGDFTFECSKTCPGGQKIIGKLSVIPPEQ